MNKLSNRLKHRRLTRIAVTAVLTALAILPAAPAGAESNAPAATAGAKLPVVYISGSNEPKASAEYFRSALESRGFDVHVFLVWEPDRPETSPYVTVKGNSRRIPEFIEKVKRETGSDKVDVVTFSQGGLVTRYWLKYYGGAADVRNAVILSGLIKGSPYQTEAIENDQCPPSYMQWAVPEGYRTNPTDACLEMAYGGAEVTALNTPTEALPGIRYYNITTRQEFDAAPYQINLMDGPGDYVNIVTQDLCPNDPVTHLGMTYLPSVHSLIESALKGGPLKMECAVPAPEGAPTLDDAVPPLESAPSFG